MERAGQVMDTGGHEVPIENAVCLAGACLINDVEDLLRQADFGSIRLDPRNESGEFIREWAPGRHIEDFVVSATIEVLKP